MSNKDKRSRLEKLLCVLEDSKHDHTLRFAAQKIADVALQQPHHIPSVLRQVHQKLYSREWRTRVYAGDILADLAQRVEHCTVDECLTGLSSDPTCQNLCNTLKNFSLNAVLLSGTTLVSGNQGSEPEVLSFDDVRAQLCSIKAHFSLNGSDGTHAGATINGSPTASRTDPCSMIKVETFSSESTLGRAPKRKHCDIEKEASPSAAATEAEDAQHNIQSARERNRIKRQVKTVDRQASGMLDSKCPSASALPAVSEQMIAADEEQESKCIENGGWPFQRVADQLIANLLDTNWQVRHGAAVGLRQLLRVQASSAAVQAPVADPLTGWRRRGSTGPMSRLEMTPEQQRKAVQANYQWLQDTIFVLLVLLVLDRFADYHNDSATAPVRETAAQAIAFAAAASPQAVRQQLLEQLINLQHSQVWEVRHGSMMCIKCIMAVDTEAACTMVDRILPVLMKGMSDSDDDVRASAVQACVPLADTLVQKAPGMVSELITCLWELLPSFDEVSPAPASVLQLLGILTEHCVGVSSIVHSTEEAPVKEELKIDVAESNDKMSRNGEGPTDSPLQSLTCSLGTSAKTENAETKHQCGFRTQFQASSDREGYLLSFIEQLPHLWPFFDHSSAQVRFACIACCTRFMQGMLSQPDVASCYVSQLRTILRLTYQVFVAAADSELLSNSETLLLLVLKSTPKHTLAEALDAATLYALMDLPCTPLGALLPPIRLLRFPSCGVETMNAQNNGSDGLGGIGTFHFGDQNCDDADNAATARRIACARMVGLAASATASVEKGTQTNKEILLTAQNFRNLIATYLYSNVALQRSFGALVMMSWMQLHDDPGSVIPEDLSTPLFKALADASTVPMQETAAPMQALHTQLAQVLEAFAVAGTPIQLPPEVTLQCVTTVYAQDILNSLDSSYGDIAVMQRQACRDAIAHAESIDKVTRLRLSAVVASACVSCQRLPDKVSSAIQPLMAGLRNIQETSLQQVIAAAVANAITMCIDRKPAAVDKVLSHLRSFACTSVAPQLPPFQCSGTFSSASLTSFPTSSSVTLPPIGYSYAESSSNDRGVKPPEAVAREGAEAALQHVASRLGAGLPERLPQLWTMVTSPVISLAESCNRSACQSAQPQTEAHDRDLRTHASPMVAANCFSAPLGGSHELAVAGQHEDVSGPGHIRGAQMAAEAMQLLQCIAPALHVQLHKQLAQYVGQMMLCLVHVPAGLRAKVCGGMVQLTLSEPSVYLDAVVTSLLPCLETSAAACERSAAALLLAQLLATDGPLTVPLLPYAALLTVPTLALMTDPELAVRTTAAAAFGRLMSILPMAFNQPLPELATLDSALREKRNNDLRFLEQLMDTQSVAAFEPPVTPEGVTLRAYQRDGVSWLAFLQKFGLHGVLADDMGLGKTVQTLTIIACNMVPSGPSAQGSEATHSSAARVQLPSLIVCPATLLGHWAQETKRYFGHIGLRTVRYQGTAEQRQVLQRQICGGVLVVASYETVRADISWFSGLRFQYCALDEGHIIRNSKTKVTQACKQIVANHRLVLSGTPVQNNVTELWSLFDFLMPGYLGTETEFNSKYRCATMPKESSRRSARDKNLGSQLGALDSLHKQILPFVLRRTKEQVLNDLPPKIIQDIICELTSLQRRLYEVATAGTSANPLAAVSSSQGQPGQAPAPVFNVLQCLRKLCSHPSLMLNLQDDAHLSALRHAFPSLDVNSRAAVDAELSSIDQSPKLLALRQLLSNAGIIVGASSAGGADGESDAGTISGDSGQHRVLCFAQMKGTLDLVESVVLDPEGVSYLRLDGDVSPAKRSDIVHQFNTDPTVDVMLLTTAAGCHGLNLTTANVVVFLEHDWNPMKDMQAMDRAHRLGQKRTVTVYRLLTEGTLEEHIMSLQQFKVDIANTVVNAENFAMDSMDTGAVLDLMSGAPAAKDVPGQGKQTDTVPGSAGKRRSQIMSQVEQEDTSEKEYNEFAIERFMHTVRPKRNAEGMK